MSSNLVLGGVVSDSSQDVSEVSLSQTPESSPNIGLIKSAFSTPDSELVTSPVSLLPHGTPKSDFLQKRRSSSRSIKRKKFDDEVVESSLVKTPRTRPLSGQMPSTSSALGIPAPVAVSESSQIEPPVIMFPERKKYEPAGWNQTSSQGILKPSKSTPKRVKKSKNSQTVVTKDLGRWKPIDDYSLILAVQQTTDLESVHRGVKFSCKFTLQEIQERWYALLYDPVISKVAVNAMKQLHPDVIASVQARALFSQEEEKLLGTILSTRQPTVDIFQELLEANPETFLPSRTAKVLMSHWTLMKQYHLLPDQVVQPKGEHVLNFSDAEDMLEDSELQAPKDENLEHELSLADRGIKKEIRQLENELPKWQVLVDSVTGVSPPDFDNQTLAVLRGRLVRYLMRSKEITIGRVSKDTGVDVDLSLEGPAWKVSRRQGVIKLRNTGDFIIANEGKRPIYIDGKPVLAGNKHKLNNNSVVEIAGLRFIFLINQDLISAIRSETSPQACT